MEGGLKTEKWEDKEGNRKQATKIVRPKLIKLGTKKWKKGEDAEFGPDDKPFWIQEGWVSIMLWLMQSRFTPETS
jgi:single-stranded DNA-binding protein